MVAKWFSNSQSQYGVESNHNSLRRAFVHSLEGGIYLLELESGGVSRFVECEESKKIKTFRSYHLARDYAKELKISDVELVFNTPYDQMIGLASSS